MKSAIILVGGEARRANGQEKYFFTYRGKTFIERLVESLKTVADEIILVARDPDQCRRFQGIYGVRCITDIRKGLGPVGGLHAGALAALGDVVFVSACDMPCVNPAVVARLFDEIDGYDAVIPQWNPEMLEPLHAVYRRSSLLSYLESHDSLSLRFMIKSLHTRYVPIAEIRRLDPGLATFTNINKIEELARMKMQESGDE